MDKYILLISIIMVSFKYFLDNRKDNYNIFYNDSIFTNIRKNTFQEKNIKNTLIADSVKKKYPIIFFPDLGTCNLMENEKLLWPPSVDNKEQIYKWLDKIKIKYDTRNNRIYKDNIVPVTDLKNNSVYSNFYKNLKEAGYKKNNDLFIVNYDFRKIAYTIEDTFKELNKLIKFKCIIIGHGLGTLLANLFLIRQSDFWKKKYIHDAHYISPCLAGYEKSMSILISGENLNKVERPFFRTIIRNYSGLLLCLPNPDVYKEKIINDYTASDIYTLLSDTGAIDSAEFYNNICLPLQKEAFDDPGVKVTCYSGQNIPTETKYTYKYELLDESSKKQYILGDGICTDTFIPKEWDIRYYKNYDYYNILNNPYLLSYIL